MKSATPVQAELPLPYNQDCMFRSRAAEIIAGALWGALLSALAMFAMAAGHGVYFPAALISAPFAAFGVLSALAGTVILWTGFAALAHRRINAVLLAVHYLGIVTVYFVAPDFWDLEYFNHANGQLRIVVYAAVVFYLFGQALILLATVRAFLKVRYATRVQDGR